MLSITVGQLKNDIAGKMKGTSIRQLKDFYSTIFSAYNRMGARIDIEESRRTATISTPFHDNINDYSIADDYKRMIDIRPQANRINEPGLSHYQQTTARQFNENLTPDSFSIRWNNMVRTLRAQKLPTGNVVQMDSLESPTSNGIWTGEGDVNTLYTENLNYVNGMSSLAFDLSGVAGSGDIINTTAAVMDLSSLNYNDTSFLYVYIPVGFSSRFTSFSLRRGSDASNYKEAIAITKSDGTAFSDGWNFLQFNWNTATTTGAPTNTLNTYRRFSIVYSAGTVINGFLINNWTDSLGTLYEMEYYSEYGFRSSTGVWKIRATADTDLINVGPASYEILKNEVMVDVVQEIRTGNEMTQELNDFRMFLNGQPPNRYVREPQYRGLYSDYANKFPSSAIVSVTKTYIYDL